MTLPELLQKLTYREYVVRLRYIKREEQRETPLVYLLAQIAYWIKLTRGGKTKARFSEFLNPFKTYTTKRNLSSEEVTAQSKSAWTAWLSKNKQR